MGLFGSRQPAAQLPLPDGPRPIPVAAVDVTKRYDMYCSDLDHDKLFENVRIVGIRTFERVNEYFTGLAGGFLEIEAVDGTRMLIPSFGIKLICEHGSQPMFKVLRRRRGAQES